MHPSVTVLIALGSFVLYIVAYRTYGRYLARRIFRVDPSRVAPSVELEDGVDYVPSRRALVFGHHFTSIAGTGPIVGPAVAVVWGWVPALIWVLVGSIVMGAVHDFGSLVVSMRHRGRTIADLAGDVVTPRVRLLFLLVVLVGLWIVLAVFGLVIAVVFQRFPSSVIPVFLQIPIAVGLGIWIRRSGSLLWGSIVAVILMYASIAWSASIGWQTASNPDGVALLPDFITAVLSPVAFWTLVLLGYVFIASVLPVQVLLQPRDFINSHQLLIAMGLLLGGVLVAHPPIVADAVNTKPAPAGNAPAPPFVPFLFVTIACGAISGFHCLVASGCSSRQLRTEGDAQAVGFGAMLTEGFLATLVILACVAGIGMGTEGWRVITVVPDSVGGTLPVSATLTGEEAWLNHYAEWGGDSGLGDKLAPFIRGSANMIETLGVPFELAVAIMGVFVASFAATTLDSATRLQRYVIAELAGAGRLTSGSCCGSCGYSLAGVSADRCPECGSDKRTLQRREQTNIFLALLGNRFVATALAVVSAGLLALSDGVRTHQYYPGVQLTTMPGGLQAAAPAKGVNTNVKEVRRAQEANKIGIHVRRRDNPDFDETQHQFTSGGFSLPPSRTGFSLDFTQAGKGGLVLWPVFGATNQLLAGLALLVVTVWLVRQSRPAWVTALPMLFMLAMTGWAIALLIKGFYESSGQRHLLVVASLMLALELWIVVEAAVLVLNHRRRAKP